MALWIYMAWTAEGSNKSMEHMQQEYTNAEFPASFMSLWGCSNPNGDES